MHKSHESCETTAIVPKKDCKMFLFGDEFSSAEVRKRRHQRTPAKFTDLGLEHEVLDQLLLTEYYLNTTVILFIYIIFC
jgi:hypothetical protein